MTDFSLSSTNDASVSVPRLRDDGSNWSDYEPRIRRALGSKGLWEHVGGTALVPQRYAIVANISVLADGTTAATEDQVEAREDRVKKYNKESYLAQHVILSTTSPRLGAKIKNLTTAKEMWDIMKADATEKSTLFLIDAEDTLSSMRCSDSSDPKTHLAEIKAHFELMVQRRDSLSEMGSTLSDTRFSTMIMLSLPVSYRPALQTITAAERVQSAQSTTPGTTGTPARKMSPTDLIAFFLEEANHRVIEEAKHPGETALFVQSVKQKHPRGRGKPKHGKLCDNCHGKGHVKEDCWSKGGGKEGQGPRQKAASRKGESKPTEVAAVAAEEKLFAFTCTSDFADVAQGLDLPTTKLGGGIIDAGASSHFCPDRAKFRNYHPLVGKSILTADGRSHVAAGVGDVIIHLPNGDKRGPVMLKEAVHAPGFSFTLISVGRLDDAGCKTIFGGGMCTILDTSGKSIATVPKADGLYRLVEGKSTAETEHANFAAKMSISEAHRKFGHIAHTAVRHAINNGLVTGIEIDHASVPEFCDSCAKAKSNTHPFPKESDTRAEEYGERVHWDLWGPAAVQAIDGSSYCAARIDDATREMYLFFLKKKSETEAAYKKDEAYLETQTGRHIKYARFDRGGEFMSTSLKDHQDKKGTTRELAVHDSQSQNGVSERGMRTRAEQARALLIEAGLPRFLWRHAMEHSAWLRNRTPTHALDGKTPYEARKGKKPHLAGLQEFGAAAYVKDNNAGKLDSRARVGRFVGYDTESKGFRIYFPERRIVSIERNVVFNKNDVTVVIPGEQSEGEKDKVIQLSDITTKAQPTPPETGCEDVPPVTETVHAPKSVPFPSNKKSGDSSDDLVDDPPNDAEPAYGRGHRNAKKHDYKALGGGKPQHANIAVLTEDEYLHDFYTGDFDANCGIITEYALASSMGREPRSLEEALRGPNAKQWADANEYEIGQLEKNRTWDVVILPAGKKPIPVMAVLKSKPGEGGGDDIFRVRYVAGGHKQVEGVDYSETFAAAAKMPSFRVVLGNAAQEDWEIHQVDVKSAYLNAPLEETVYMLPPPGVLRPGQEGMVCHLKKGLYGLKQAGRGWQKMLTAVFINDLGFKRSAVDHSVFILKTDKEHTVVAVATDDMAVTSRRISDVAKFKSELRKHFDITDLGEMTRFLGFDVRRDRAARTIAINQEAYIKTLGERFRLTDAKPVTTPMDSGVQFSKEQGPSTPTQIARMKGVPYSEAIGSILWPVMVSRPDAAFAVSTLSQFIQNPGPAHWEGVKRVISYLLTTKDHWLTWGGRGKTIVEAYCDADWGEKLDRHSVSGYSFHMGQGAVTWSSKKQHIIALSSTEAEYIAQTHAAKEALWIRTFIGEFRQGFSSDPIPINCDNQSAIALAKDNKFHARTKHIDIRYHFIREAVEDRKIELKYIPTDDNVADTFTKALAKGKFRLFAGLLGLREA